MKEKMKIEEAIDILERTYIIAARRSGKIQNLKALALAINALRDRPTGEWKDLSDGWQEGTYECSNCKTEFVLTEGTPEDNEYHFCPNCGAKMNQEQEDQP